MRLVESTEAYMNNADTVFLGTISRCQNAAGQSIKGCESGTHSTEIRGSSAAMTPRNSASPLSRPIEG